MTASLRFPAEWEPQSAVLIAWPHAGTDWAERLAAVEDTYIALVAAIVRFEPVLVCVADDAVEAHARARLVSARVDMARVRFVSAPYDDTWLRDSGPITLVAAGGPPASPSPPAEEKEPAQPAAEAPRFHLLDFRFTGWGGKFDARRDDRLVERLQQAGIFIKSKRHSIDFALEGGAIETDGAGTLLTTWRCLHERHPQTTRETLSNRLAGWLRQERVLWLDHGYLEGDDTDAHIDTLARFAATDAIVFQACDDPADTHHAELQAMAAELAALRTRDGRPYRLFPLPWPRPIHDHGRRLAASYANFLIVDGAVLMPAYGLTAEETRIDAAAAAVLADAFPGREIVPVPCRPLIWQNGSLHCLTMQLPAGLV
ncbi:agmatine deiminase family protein [Cognatiluteimonas weifangensis]|uniref:Agmatine deiminase family protein n=1 Tax=Cognatiluteimonas weifangensis TaxID=2303539 RepID=A0A372DNV7_9GAMM|nr:agmatine deiminase family protein [Luteimonas weifangensis]RFP61164.1 agmatine deiminase family protein [Luteimonas weifangensis]